MKKSIEGRSISKVSPDSKGITLLFRFLFCSLFVGSFFAADASAQAKKSEKVPSQGKLSARPLDTASKAKKFEDLSDFVIVDQRSTAVADLVDADPEGGSSLKRDMEEMFPFYTVFATSDPNVCVIGVTSPADAKTVFTKTNPKKSRIAKRDNIGKMLTENNVKLITKEK